MYDKYKAIWVSHSSMGDFLKCPRLYYLHNVYKDPRSGNKIALVSPHMSLGVAVHNVLENLVNFPKDERLKQDLFGDYEKNWQKVSGKIGGFKNDTEEAEFKKRGEEMIQKVLENPRMLVEPTINFYKGDMLPNYWLNGEEDNIILCGKVDWIEYLPDDTLRVIDFKTGKSDEKEGSLQFPIYHLLLANLQKRKVSSAAYWYLDRDEVQDAELLNTEESFNRVYEVAKQVKEARIKNEYFCPKGKDGCIHCNAYEKILRGDAEYVGTGEYRQDLYLL